MLASTEQPTFPLESFQFMELPWGQIQLASGSVNKALLELNECTLFCTLSVAAFPRSSIDCLVQISQLFAEDIFWSLF